MRKISNYQLRLPVGGVSHTVYRVRVYHPFELPSLQILLGSLSLLITSTILLHGFLGSVLVLLKVLHLFAIHVLHDIIRLPLLEAETETFMAVVLVVCLILMVLDLNKVRVYSVGIEGKRYEGVDGCCFGDDFEGPRLA